MTQPEPDETTVRYADLHVGDYFARPVPTGDGGAWHQIFRVTAVLPNGTKTSAPIGPAEARTITRQPPTLEV